MRRVFQWMKSLWNPPRKRRRHAAKRSPIDAVLHVRELEERRVFHAGPLTPGPGADSQPTPEPLPPVTPTVTLDSAHNLVVQDLTGRNDQLTVRFDQDQGRYEIYDPTQLLHTDIEGATGSGTHRLFIPYEVVTGGQLRFDTGGGNDSLTVDFSGGDPNKTVVFNGGEGDADTLRLVGGTADRIAYHLSSADTVAIELSSVAGQSRILVTSVEPIHDDLVAGRREFLAGTGVTSLELSDDGIDANGRSLVQSSLGSSITFVNPTSLLTLDSTTVSDGSLTVFGVDATWDADLRLAAGESGAARFLGQLDLNGGSLAASAGTIEVRGTVSTSAATIDLRATSLLAVTSSGLVRNPTGQVLLDGGSQGTLQLAGRIDVSSDESGQHGGQVQLLGNRVELSGNAAIDATGHSGGGQVLVGGDYQGQNPAVRRATFTSVGSGVSIDASATHLGNGGRIIVWADDAAIVEGSGNLRARGGQEGGNGGLIETSGKRWLHVGAAPDASAPAGKGGLWLLDPRNVRIVAGGSGTLSGGVLDPSANDTTIDAAVIVAALEAGTNVTIYTGDSGSQAGNIIVDQEIVVSAASGTVTLTLNAANNIEINQAIRSENPVGDDPGLVLHVVLNANTLAGGQNNDPNRNAGDVSIAAAIETNGGNVTTSGVDFSSTAAGTLTTSGGTITLNHTGNVTVGGAVATGGANFSSNGDDFTSTATIASAGGDVTLDHDGAVSVGATVDLAGGNFVSNGTTFDNTGGAITSTGSGTLTFTDNDPATQASGTLDLTATGATINIVAVAGGAADGIDGNQVRVILQAGGAGTAASYDAATHTITVPVNIGTNTVNGIVSKINNLAAFNATLATGTGTTEIAAGDLATYTGLFTGGADVTTGSDVISITSLPGGPAFTGTLTFNTSALVPSGDVNVVVDANNNITITASSLSSYLISDLAAAIQAELPDYAVVVTQSQGDGNFAIGDAVVAAASTGGNVTLTHTGDVTLGAAVTLGGGNFSSAGAAFNNTGGAIATGGGNATLTHTGAVTIAAAVELDGGSFLSEGTTFTSSATITTTGTGDITLDHSGDVAVGAAVSLETGTFSSSGINFDNTGGTITTTGGDVTLTHTGSVTIAAVVSLSGGSFSSEGTTFTSTATITTSGTGNITLDHSSDVTVGAAVSLATGTFSSSGDAFDNTGGTITTTGGDVSLTHTGSVTIAAAVALAGGSLSSEGTTFTSTATITTSGTGNITLDHSGDVDVGAAVSLGTGTFSSSGVNFDNTGGTITTTGGDVTLTHTGSVTIAAAVALAGGSLSSEGTTFDSTATITTSGTGNITLDHSGDVAVGAAVSLATGTFSSSGVNFDNTGGTITATGGSVDLTHTGDINLGANISLGSGSATIATTGAGRTVDLDAGVIVTALQVSITATGQITAGAGSLIDTSAAGGSVSLAGSQLGSSSTLPLHLKPGTGSVSLTATSGDIFVQIEDGSFSTSQLSLLRADAANALIWLRVANGTLTINDTAWFGAGANTTANDRFELTAAGAAGDIVFSGNTTLTAAEVTLRAARDILGGTSTTADVSTTAASGNIHLFAARRIGDSANPFLVRAGSGSVFIGDANLAGNVYLSSTSQLNVGSVTTSSLVAGQTIEISTQGSTSDLTFLADVSTNDNLRIDSARNLVVSDDVTITASIFTLLRAAGAIVGGGTDTTDFAMTDAAAALSMAAGTIGTQANPVKVDVPSGLLNLTATSGSLWVELAVGNLLLSNVSLSVPTPGATIGLSTTSGDITYNAATFTGLDDNQLYLDAGGAGNIFLNGEALTFHTVTLLAGGNIVGTAGGGSTAITSTVGGITLQSTGAIGQDPLNRLVVSSAGPLQVTTTGASGNIYIRSLGTLDLGAISAQDPGAQTIDIETAGDLTLSQASGTNDNWVLAADNSILFGTAGSIRANNVTLIAYTGSITGGNSAFDVALDGGGGVIILSAATGIGQDTNPLAAAPVDGQIGAFTSSGDIYLDVTGGDFSTANLLFFNSGGVARTLRLGVSSGTLQVNSTLDYAAPGHTLQLAASDDVAFAAGGSVRAAAVALDAGDAILGTAGIGANDIEITAPAGRLSLTAASGIGVNNPGNPALSDPLQIRLAPAADVVAETTDAGAAIILAAADSTLLGQFTTNNGTIDLNAAAIGQSGGNVALTPGLGNLRLQATTGDIFATLVSSDFVASQVTLLSAAKIGAIIDLRSASGDILLDDLAGFSANTIDDRFQLFANDDINFRAVTLRGAFVNLNAGGAITSDSDATSDIDTSSGAAGVVTVQLNATGPIGDAAARLAVRGGSGWVSATTTAGDGNVFLRGDGVLNLGTVSTQSAGGQQVNILADDQLNVRATSTTNDIWTINANGTIQFVGAVTIAAGQFTADAAGAILSGTQTDIDTSAANGDIDLDAASIGSASNPLDLLPGTGDLSLEAAAGGIWVDIPSGNLNTTQVTVLNAAGVGQTVSLRTLNGSLTIGGHSARFNTVNDLLFLTAGGTGSIVAGSGATPLAAAELHLIAGGGIGTSSDPVVIGTGNLFTQSSRNQYLARPPVLRPGVPLPMVVRSIEAIDAGVRSTVFLQAGLITFDGVANAHVAVANGTELAGRGAIQGNLTVASGGILDPGLTELGAGQLTIDGMLTLRAGSEVFFDINAPYTQPGTDYDQLVAGGGATIENAVLRLRGGDGLQSTIGGIVLIQLGGASPSVGQFLVGPPSAVTSPSAGVFEVQIGTFKGPLLYIGGDGNDIAIQELFLNPPIQRAAFTLPEFRLPILNRPEPPPLAEELPAPVPTPVEPPLVEAEVDTTGVRKIQIRLVSTIDDEGNVVETLTMELDVEWLSNLKGILYLLPDDRYRIYLILEGGESRRVMDVVLRDGRPFEPEDVRAAIQSRRTGNVPEKTPVELPSDSNGLPKPPPTPLPEQGFIPQATPLPGPLVPSLLPAASPEVSSEHADSHGPAGASWYMVHAGAAVAAVAAARRESGSWEREADRVAERVGEKSGKLPWRLWRRSRGTAESK